MATQSVHLQVRGLGKYKMAALRERAKHLGLTPQRYLRHLLEEDLAISERAKKSSFVQLLGSGQDADETEIDQLVEAARNEYYQSRRRKD